MGDYIQIPVHESIPENSRYALEWSLKRFRGPLELGCTIAGGFVRAMYRGQEMEGYFGHTKDGLPGDIDIFLPGGIEAKDVYSSIGTSHRKLHRSHAGFGHNFTTSYDGYITPTVQLIDYPDFCSPSPTGVLDRFDFTNVAIAISLVEGKPTLTVHREWRELEDSGLLGIKRVNSPFLGKRVVKYLKSKGLSGLSSDSAPRITEWLARCANENFGEGDLDYKHQTFLDVAKAGVMGLFANGWAPKEDIIMFLGKWEVTVYDRKEKDYSGFNSSETVDWALNKMNEAQKQAEML